MLNWLKISLLLCFFGFLKEFRPSEPFVSDYLTIPWRNITQEQLNKYVWPNGTYSTAIQLIIVLLITDFLRYKPIIVVCGISGIVTWSLLVWTTSLEAAILIQVTYGTYIATEVAYYTYIYAKVDKEHYLKVTSHTRAAILCGRFLSGVTAQTMVVTQWLNLRELHMLTLGGQIAATLWAFLLPPVRTSLYFNRDQNVLDTTRGSRNTLDTLDTSSSLATIECNDGTCKRSQHKYSLAFATIRSDLYTAYTNPNVLLWSFWYAAGMCGQLQVISYIQMLWISIDNSPEVMWNGAIEACATISGATVALLASKIHEGAWTRQQKLWFLVVFSILQGTGLFVAANTSDRFVSYAGYMLYYILYTFTITISSAEIARNLPTDSFGLIFGVNTFVALIIQVILTVAVVTNSFGFNFNMHQQFFAYSGFYIVLGLLYLIPISCNLICTPSIEMEHQNEELKKEISLKQETAY